ncbi:MAG: hypothetical protein FWG68_08070 [Defluviitaleaceae bacterium]|nr:hypothetical protein [Defluviitaleaceae bacterium]
MIRLNRNGKTGDRPPAYTFVEPLGIRRTGDRPRSPVCPSDFSLSIRRCGSAPMENPTDYCRLNCFIFIDHHKNKCYNNF